MGKTWNELRTRVFSKGPLFRIVTGTAVSCALILLIFKLLMPQLNLWVVWPVIFALPAILLYLLSFLGLIYLFRPRVDCNRKRILYQIGQTAIHILYKDIVSAKIVFFAEDLVRMKLHYRKNKSIKQATVGIPAEVDFEQLLQTMGVEPRIVDARHRELSATRS